MEENIYNENMTASLTTSDMHIQRIFLLWAERSGRGDQKQDTASFSLHTNTVAITHTHEHTPDVRVDRARAEREMVMWIKMGRGGMDHFANTAI